MAYIIEITEDKFEELGENVEKMLRYGGKVMSCIDHIRRKSGQMDERGSMNERDFMDYRNGGGSMNNRSYMNERGSMGERENMGDRHIYDRRVLY